MIFFRWFQIYELFLQPLSLIDADVVGRLGGLGEDVKSMDEDVGTSANEPEK